MGLSLGKAVVHYQIAESRRYQVQKRKRHEYKTVLSFVGSHNAGNDAAVNLRLQIQLAFDPQMECRGRGPSWIVSASEPVGSGAKPQTDVSVQRDVAGESPDFFKWNAILVCVDVEKVDWGANWGAVSGFGIAVLDTAKLRGTLLVHTAPSWRSSSFSSV